MTPIPPFHVLAKDYGANIGRFRGQLTVSLACNADCDVDIGFTAHRRSLIASLLHSPSRFEIADGLFTYGRGSLSAGELIRGDVQLCGALNLLLSNFRCTVEWSGHLVSVRVGGGVADGDATGGQRFLSNLALVANKLGEIGKHMVVANSSTEGFGPALLRRITFAAGFSVPLVLLFTVRYWIRRG